MASTLSTIQNDLSLPEDCQALLKEAMKDFERSEHERAKKIIQGRLLEIKRMEACIERAKADLAKLLNRSVDEILMLED
jgi:hypothetical protein